MAHILDSARLALIVIFNLEFRHRSTASHLLDLWHGDRQTTTIFNVNKIEYNENNSKLYYFSS